MAADRCGERQYDEAIKDWNKKEGYPSKSFLKALDPSLRIMLRKVILRVIALGTKAGEISEQQQS